MKINDLNIGHVIQPEAPEIYLLSSVKVSNFKNKEGEYLDLIFSDSSGSISGKLWEVPKSLSNLKELCEEHDGLYVYVVGKIQEYKNQNKESIKQIVIDNISIVVNEHAINYENFLPSSKFELNLLIEELRRLIDEINDPNLKLLVRSIFNDEEYRHSFIRGIAGLKHHHNYLHGLLEHSIQVTILSLVACDHPLLFRQLNRDLIIVCGLLHDIGKVKEYLFKRRFSYNPLSIDHRYEGIAIIEKTIFKYNIEIDPKVLRDIKLIIASHHGAFGDNSIKMDIPEAIVIHNSDALSAGVNEMLLKNSLL